MKRYFLSMLVISACAVFAHAQKLASGAKPRAVKIAEMLDAHCTTLPGNTRVCKGRNANDESGDGIFIIQRNGVKLGEIKGAISANGASPESFFALSGDLDKNKSAELVIVDFGGQSNGLGVNYYTVNIFPDFQTKGFQTPLSFDTHEFGTEGTFRYDTKTNETLIMLSEWGGVNVPDAKRGGGTYFTGRFFRYQNGKLKPAAGRPILARRLLNSFARERARTDASPLRPYNWLSSPQAVKLKGDPVFDEKPISSETGVIEKYEDVTEKFKSENGGEETEVNISQIVVRMDSGERKTVVLFKGNYYDNLPERANRISPETFGILPVRMTLPTDFSPLLVFDDLAGMRVQLNAYTFDADSAPVYRLWFIEK